MVTTFLYSLLTPSKIVHLDFPAVALLLKTGIATFVDMTLSVVAQKCACLMAPKTALVLHQLLPAKW